MDKEAASRQVGLVLDRINQAWLEGRLEELVPLFDEDIVMSLPGGAVRISGRAVIVASFEQFVREARILDFHETDRQIDVLGPGDVAVGSFGYVLVYMRHGETYRATGRDLWIFRAAENRSYRAVFRTMFDLAEEPVRSTS